MVEVAAFAANRAGVVVATITVTDWREMGFRDQVAQQQF